MFYFSRSYPSFAQDDTRKFHKAYEIRINVNVVEEAQKFAIPPTWLALATVFFSIIFNKCFHYFFLFNLFKLSITFFFYLNQILGRIANRITRFFMLNCYCNPNPLLHALLLLQSKDAKIFWWNASPWRRRRSTTPTNNKAVF